MSVIIVVLFKDDWHHALECCTHRHNLQTLQYSLVLVYKLKHHQFKVIHTSMLH